MMQKYTNQNNNFVEPEIHILFTGPTYIDPRWKIHTDHSYLFILIMVWVMTQFSNEFGSMLCATVATPSYKCAFVYGIHHTVRYWLIPALLTSRSSRRKLSLSWLMCCIGCPYLCLDCVSIHTLRSEPMDTTDKQLTNSVRKWWPFEHVRSCASSTVDFVVARRSCHV